MRATSLILLACLTACGEFDPVVNATTATSVDANASVAEVPAAPAASIAVTRTVGTAGAKPPTAVAALTGRWRVTGVQVKPGPVSAVDADDPTLMGAVFSATPELLSWEPHEGGFFTDTCPSPQIGPDRSVDCAEGQFGPPDMYLVQDDDRLRMDWYDGAVLLLSRIK